MYKSIICFILGLAGGAACGAYYAKSKCKKQHEDEINSVVTEFEAKLEELRNRLIEAAAGPKEDEDGEGKPLTPNGDVSEETEEEPYFIEEEEVGLEPLYSNEEVVYYANDRIFYNLDLEKTYNQDKEDMRFKYPLNLFSKFGKAPKHEHVYLADDVNHVYYTLSWNEGSYASEVLGYESKEE